MLGAGESYKIHIQTARGGGELNQSAVTLALLHGNRGRGEVVSAFYGIAPVVRLGGLCSASYAEIEFVVFPSDGKTWCIRYVV